MYRLVVAVDFDGTIVEHDFPRIGNPLPNAFKALKELQKMGHILILWTCRTNDYLREAADYCEQNSVKFDYLNDNASGSFKDKSFAYPKIYYDVCIDDRNIGGFIGWDNVLKEIKKLM
ncbi:MAG: hydrolase [Bacteroidetes bacterium]|nr:hydrolase [Bacteroidota bacterium]